MTKPSAASNPLPRYVVRWDGEIVGTKQNPKYRYTHAVIGQVEEKGVREWAYATPAKDDRYRQLYDYYEKYVREGPDAHYPRFSSSFEAETRAEYAARIAGGFDAFVEQWRNRRIEFFKAWREDHRFDVQVLRWLKPGETNKMRPSNIALEMYHTWGHKHGHTLCETH